MPNRRTLVGKPRYNDPSSGEVYDYTSPHGEWISSESRLNIGPHGPEPIRETSSGHLARANGPPSRSMWRASDRERAIRYVRTGNTDQITTAQPGDFHRHRVDEAAYYTTSERYADELASRGLGGTGMVIQQAVPSRLLDGAYVFPERPGNDWRETVHTNRIQGSTPRQPPAVAESRQRSVVIGPTAHVQTSALLRRTKQYPSGPEFEKAFHPVQELSREDPRIDTHRRGPIYPQQVRFQADALTELAKEPRHARPARPPRRH